MKKTSTPMNVTVTGWSATKIINTEAKNRYTMYL